MRFRMSGLKILGMFAALTLVAGCGSTADRAGSSSSYGSSSSTTGTVSTTAAGSQEDLAVNVGDRVHFDYDSFELTAEARGVLERQAAWLKSNASINVMRMAPSRLPDSEPGPTTRPKCAPPHNCTAK